MDAHDHTARSALLAAPEVHRIKDAELEQPGQLKDYLAIVERAFSAVHLNIESLYDDLFIETCDPWVIPYIGDLLGMTHLSGDDWTLRADVADTIALRRRKGTLGAIELLAFDLTEWGSHCVELRELMAWTQHLNHQRPDAGGDPPYASGITRFTIPRGGTIPLRDPASLSLLGTPFDTFAHIADVRPPTPDSIRINLPNLAIFLWRLAAYQVQVSAPVWRGTPPAYSAAGAPVIARFDIHPMGEPVRLFNTARFDPDSRPLVLSRVDETPGPIPTARLRQGDPAGRPDEYVAVETYDETDPTLANLVIQKQGLQLYLPDGTFHGDVWTIRGENLCAWETGIEPPLQNREIAIDPVIGRVAFGLAQAAERTALQNDLLVSYTYGAVGPVGAHPISRESAPATWLGEAVAFTAVDYHVNKTGLQNALNNIENSIQPIVIEIQDSMTHDLDLAAVAGVLNEAGGPNLMLNRTLIIRAADGQRPVIQLARPLRFRPTNVLGGTPAQQLEYDAVVDRITVRLEGLYLTRDAGFNATDPLIARAAVHSLELVGCTLDPGGYEMLGGGRAPIRDAVSLEEPYGFAPATETAFKPTPEVHLQRSIAGPMRLDDIGYTLFLEDSVIDAGAGVADSAVNAIAVGGATDPVNGWGPVTQVSGITVFGRTRARTVGGRGGIWVHQLEVFDNQKGCIKLSYFPDEANRLPQNHACVYAPDAKLRFTDEAFGRQAYGQLSRVADFRILERGPNDDEMGAFGFLLEAHRWHNLNIRFREFMPLGVRPLLIPVT